jgi:hypothetical protein
MNNNLAKDIQVTPTIVGIPLIGMFMAGTSRILTAVLFATHLMVGCCAHHSHACGDLASAQECTTPDGLHSRGQKDHSDHGQSDCQGDRCVFVQAANNIVVKLPSRLFQPITPLQSDGVPVLIGVIRGPALFSTGQFRPLARLHLIKQVMLI